MECTRKINTRMRTPDLIPYQKNVEERRRQAKNILLKDMSLSRTVKLYKIKYQTAL